MTLSIAVLNPRPLRHLSSHLTKLVAGRLWLKVLLGMFCGILVGVLLGPSLALVESDTSSLIGNWLAFPGQLFLILVQMIVVPLVFASIIRGLAATDDINQLKKLGLSVVAFFILSTTFALLLALIWLCKLNPEIISIPLSLVILFRKHK